MVRFVLVPIYLLLLSALRAETQNSATDWMPKAKFGVFAHYLKSQNNFAEIAHYNTAKVAEQLQEMNARYFVITLGQNTGYFCAPNATYEQICGYPAGSHCSTNDIPAQLIRALKPSGTRLMLYLPCQTPTRDLHAVRAFGLAGDSGDRKIDADFAAKWAQVIADWSKRYGENIAGWWFDGGYMRVGFNAEIAQSYAHALKQYNPNAVVAFNPGVSLKRNVPSDDYTAGELNEPFAHACTNRWHDGAQWHVLTYLGNTWGDRKIRYTNEQWLDWMRPSLKNGGCITIDLAVNPDGSFDESQVRQLKQITDTLKKEGYLQ